MHNAKSQREKERKDKAEMWNERKKNGDRKNK